MTNRDFELEDRLRDSVYPQERALWRMLYWYDDKLSNWQKNYASRRCAILAASHAPLSGSQSIAELLRVLNLIQCSAEGNGATNLDASGAQKGKSRRDASTMVVLHAAIDMMIESMDEKDGGSQVRDWLA